MKDGDSSKQPERVTAGWQGGTKSVSFQQCRSSRVRRLFRPKSNEKKSKMNRRSEPPPPPPQLNWPTNKTCRLCCGESARAFHRRHCRGERACCRGRTNSDLQCCHSSPLWLELGQDYPLFWAVESSEAVSPLGRTFKRCCSDLGNLGTILSSLLTCQQHAQGIVGFQITPM